MPFTKETAREAGKRSKRSKDTNVAAIRNLYAEFLDNNTDKIQSLFDRVAQEDAAKALDILFKFSSYVIAKPTIAEERAEADLSKVPKWLLPNELSEEEYQTKLTTARKVIEASEW